jgi:ribosomal protein S18 acetylase RimI-like enzyme
MTAADWHEAGRMIGVAAGYTWAGNSELKQMWIDEAFQGRGYARELLNAFVAEAVSRGVRQIWVASYDFQAPGMYEKAGFRRVAEFAGLAGGTLQCRSLQNVNRTAVTHSERMRARAR